MTFQLADIRPHCDKLMRLHHSLSSLISKLNAVQDFNAETTCLDLSIKLEETLEAIQIAMRELINFENQIVISDLQKFSQVKHVMILNFTDSLNELQELSRKLSQKELNQIKELYNLLRDCDNKYLDEIKKPIIELIRKFNLEINCYRPTVNNFLDTLERDEKQGFMVWTETLMSVTQENDNDNHYCFIAPEKGSVQQLLNSIELIRRTGEELKNDHFLKNVYRDRKPSKFQEFSYFISRFVLQSVQFFNLVDRFKKKNNPSPHKFWYSTEVEGYKRIKNHMALQQSMVNQFSIFLQNDDIKKFKNEAHKDSKNTNKNASSR